MTYSLGTVLVLAALAGSIAVFAERRDRWLAVLALVISGVQALIAFGLVAIQVKNLHLALVLGLSLVVVGVLEWARSGAKLATTGATTVTLVGALQVLMHLRVLG
jgi:uncharacterized membrane protein HdeD (DUF308 family)